MIRFFIKFLTWRNKGFLRTATPCCKNWYWELFLLSYKFSDSYCMAFHLFEMVFCFQNFPHLLWEKNCWIERENLCKVSTFVIEFQKCILSVNFVEPFSASTILSILFTQDIVCKDKGKNICADWENRGGKQVLR